MQATVGYVRISGPTIYAPLIQGILSRLHLFSFRCGPALFEKMSGESSASYILSPRGQINLSR